MEHIVNLSLAISDDDIVKRVEEQMVVAAKNTVEAALYKSRYYSGDTQIVELAKDRIDIFINEHSDEIIDGVVKALCESLPRRKFFKEAIAVGVQEE